VGEDPLGALLDHREPDAELVKFPRRGVWFPLPHRGLALVEVAHGHGHVRQRLLHPAPGLLPRRPEHRPVVQVQDGDVAPAAGRQGGERGGAARLLGQAGDRHPEHPGVADGVQIQVLGADLQVRRLGQAVEVQREVVRREDLAERHRGGQVPDRGDETVVDAVAAQRLVQEGAERVVAGAGDDGRAPPVPGRRHRDVGRAAAQVLGEALHLVQAHADLLGIQVNADPAHGENLERLGHRVCLPPRQDRAGRSYV
jgi:hypothetical protein